METVLSKKDEFTKNHQNIKKDTDDYINKTVILSSPFHLNQEIVKTEDDFFKKITEDNTYTEAVGLTRQVKPYFDDEFYIPINIFTNLNDFDENKEATLNNIMKDRNEYNIRFFKQHFEENDIKILHRKHLKS